MGKIQKLFTITERRKEDLLPLLFCPLQEAISEVLQCIKQYFMGAIIYQGYGQ